MGSQEHRCPDRTPRPDATAIADGGGLVSAELRPIEGGRPIALAFVDLAGRTPNLTMLERTVNGQPGLVAQLDGVTVAGAGLRGRRRPDQADLGSTEPREAPALEDGLTDVSVHSRALVTLAR